MTLGIDPKVDYAFKWLFGNEKNAEILIHLLHAVLNPAPEEQIVEIEILNPFTDKMRLNEKLSILDIKARDQLGRHFGIEMQMLTTPTLRQRILYYWAKLYTDQLQRGKEYGLLKPTVSICFVDGTLFPAVPSYHLSFRLMDAVEGITLSNHLSIHFLELPKFKRSQDELRTPLEAWLYFLKHAMGLNPESLTGALGAPEILHAMEALTMLSDIDMEKEIYEGRLKQIRDEHMWRTDGMEEMREQGLQQGREEGRAEGRAEGILIGRIEIAQKLLGRDTPTQEELEAMTMDALKELAASLEQELSRK